jgi:fimbrial isopeptide formation D2 family protein/LPXTG-motif cell wall-anchored protein
VTVAALLLGGVGYGVGAMPTTIGISTAQAVTSGYVEIDLHKLKNYQNGAKDGSDIANTGNELEAIKGDGSVNYLEGVTFSAYDITKYYYDYLAKNSSKTTAEELEEVKVYYAGLSSPNANQIDSTDKISNSFVKTSTPSGNTHSTPAQMELPKTSGGKNAVYVIFENSTAKNNEDTIAEAVPMVVALPVDKLETADTIHLYPKNSTSEIIKQVSDPNVAIGEEITYTIGLDIPNDFAQVVTRDGKEEFKYQNLSVTDNPEPGLNFIDWKTANYTDGTKEGTGTAVNLVPSRPASIFGLTFVSITGEATNPTGVAGSYGDGEASTIHLNTPAYVGSDSEKTALVNQMRTLAGKKLVFTVTAKINESALVGDNNKDEDGTQNNLINDASYVIGNGSGGDLTYVEGHDDVQVFTYGHKFIKKDADTAEELNGATFKVYQKSQTEVTTPKEDITGPSVPDLGNKYDDKNPIKFVLADGVYHVASEKELSDNNVTKVTEVVANPGITLSGLEAGDYFIVETKAPAGYLLNSKPLEFTVKVDNETTLTEVPSSEIDRIDNVKETSLPLTGGQGMKVVFTVGALTLTAAVGFYFMNRNRKNSKRSI